MMMERLKQAKRDYPYVMADKHVDKVFDDLRRFCPDPVSKEHIARIIKTSSNTGNVIRLLHFLGIYDESNRRTEALDLFKKDEEDLKLEMQKLVEESYGPLFSLAGEQAWNLDLGRYVSFFQFFGKNPSDSMSFYRAITFKALATWAGKRDEDKVFVPFTLLL